ncbi:MAG: hypothetical protein OWT27_10165, partial [Firmicutes bacterium]|nr:hypothetical protein [Bacillota bacterium]
MCFNPKIRRALYSKGTVITLADLSAKDTDLPSGEKLSLRESELPTDHVHIVKPKQNIVIIKKKTDKDSTQPVILFSQRNEHGLYYR